VFNENLKVIQTWFNSESGMEAGVSPCLGTRMMEPRELFLPVLASHQTYSFNLYIVLKVF
jgi:hypothetical protein